MSAKTANRAMRRRPAPELSYFRAQVVRTANVTPHMIRVTLGGPDLERFIWDGPDQRIKLFLPLPGQQEPDVPTGPDWYPRYRAMADDVRPVMRTYTIRGHRPERDEVEIDFVRHDTAPGPASAWAAGAQPGDRVGFFGPYADYDPVPEADWQLIIGDETALPSIGGILAELPPHTCARVFVEVHDAAEEQRLDTKGDVEITWLHRGAEATGRNSLLPGAVAAAELPEGRPYVWLAAETGTVRDLRRHLVNERGYAKCDIYFAGYWRHGASEEQRANEPAEDE